MAKATDETEETATLVPRNNQDSEVRGTMSSSSTHVSVSQRFQMSFCLLVVFLGAFELNVDSYRCGSFHLIICAGNSLRPLVVNSLDKCV